MEKVCRKAARKILGSAGLQGDALDKAVYGFLAVTQIIAILVGSLIVGAIFGFFVESLVIFWAVGILRRSAGGMHLGSMGVCTVVSITVISLLAAVAYLSSDKLSETIYYFTVQIVCAVITQIVLLIRAPLESSNKPLKPQKARRLKAQSCITALVYTSAAIVLKILIPTSMLITGIGYALALSLIWQCITLFGRPSSGALKKNNIGKEAQQ